FFNVNRLVDDLFRAVQVLNELGQTAVVLEDLLFSGAFVGQLDGETFVEEGQLPETGFQRVIVKGRVVEDFTIGEKGNARAGALGGANVLDFGDRLAALILLDIGAAIAAHLGLDPLRQGRDRLSANAVQPGRNFVGVLVKL